MAVSMKIQSAKDYKRSLSVLKRPVLWLSLVAAHTYWRSDDSLASIIWLFLRLAASSGVFLLLHVNCLYAYMQMTNCHKLWPCGMLWPLPGTHTDRILHPTEKVIGWGLPSPQLLYISKTLRADGIITAASQVTFLTLDMDSDHFPQAECYIRSVQNLMLFLNTN